MIWVSFFENMPGISWGIRTKFVRGTYIIVPRAIARMPAKTGLVVFISKSPIPVVSIPASFRAGTLLVDFLATIIDKRVPIRAPVVNKVEILLAVLVKSLYLGIYLALPYKG